MKPWLPAMRRHMVKRRSRWDRWAIGEPWTRQPLNAAIWKADSDAQCWALVHAARWYGKRYKDWRWI